MSIIDESDTWTEQDQLDLVAFSLQSATASYSESDELIKCSSFIELNIPEPFSE
jgi:hypothetical protein